MRPLEPPQRRGGLQQNPGHLYETVKLELTRRITEGIYQPGAKIPSERELIAEFRVSAITVRRAIRDLTVDGLLLARQGLGVFVTDNRQVVRALTTDIMTTLEDDMKRIGVVPSIKILSLAVVIERTMAGRLGLPVDSLLYRLEKVILGDGSPVVVDRAYLPRELGDTLRPELEHEHFIFPLLVTHRISVDHARFRVTGDTVSAQDAELLELAPNYPTLVLDYTVVAPDGKPVLTGQAISRADRLGYQFDVHPGLHRTDLRSPSTTAVGGLQK